MGHRIAYRKEKNSLFVRVEFRKIQKFTYKDDFKQVEHFLGYRYTSATKKGPVTYQALWKNRDIHILSELK